MNRALIHELATGRFIAQREDALFLGPPGTGKSHLAQAIGRAVIQQGYRVLYREAHTLLEELADATLDGTRKAYLADLAAVPLLIIDDLGHAEAAAHRRRRSPGSHHAPLRARVDAADVKPTRRRLGQAARRHRRRHRAARSAATSRARAQVRATELAHQGPHRLAHRRRPRSRTPPVSAARQKWPVLKCRLMAGFELSTEAPAKILLQYFAAAPRPFSPGLRLALGITTSFRTGNIFSALSPPGNCKLAPRRRRSCQVVLNWFTRAAAARSHALTSAREIR